MSDKPGCSRSEDEDQKPENLQIVRKFDRQNLPETIEINRWWETRILTLFKKQLEMESVMWNLSTLGGAYSAYADYDLNSVHVVEGISRKQLKIAFELGDENLTARCHLYLALSRAQKGEFEEAKKMTGAIYLWAKFSNRQLVIRCAQGVWAKIIAIEKIGTPAQKPVISQKNGKNGKTTPQKAICL
ncbi:hypothetical protein WR25_20289 [Diploscapter pachys]|uniref:Uncharacterized protein n=1 Tax=Diploscapter pachys TaxID=2018661 RepID=A0A2A2LPY8_9BILA|nr:hypothetical protein WR25_20289 [Diploscapter pachys]